MYILYRESHSYKVSTNHMDNESLKGSVFADSSFKIIAVDLTLYNTN